MNLNLLSRGWWDGLSFDQVKQALSNSSDSICLYGRVSNVNSDQTLDFKILCKYTWGTIKLDLTSLAVSNQTKKDLIDILNSGEYSIWIKGKVTSFPVLTACVKEWGFCWGNLLISKSLEYDLEITYDNLPDDDARKWVNILESSTNPRVKQLLEWWYWQGSGQIKSVINLSRIDILKFWGLMIFIPIYTEISIPQSIREDFVVFRRALLLASMRLVEND